MGRETTLLCIIPGHQPWFRAIPLSLSLLAGIKKGHDRPRAGGAGSGSPFAVFSGSSHSVISLFLTSPRGRPGFLFQWRGGSRGDFTTMRDEVMLDLAM